MERQMVIKLHESSRGKKFPSMTDIYLAKPGEALGEVCMSVYIDFWSDLDDSPSSTSESIVTQLKAGNSVTLDVLPAEGK